MLAYHRVYPRKSFGSAFSLYFVYVVFWSVLSGRCSRWLFLGICYDGFPVDRNMPKFGEHLTSSNKCNKQNTTEPLDEWLLQTIPMTAPWLANGTTLGHVVIRDGRFQASLETAIWGSRRSALFQGCVRSLAMLLVWSRDMFCFPVHQYCDKRLISANEGELCPIIQLHMRVMNLDISMLSEMI